MTKQKVAVKFDPSKGSQTLIKECMLMKEKDYSKLKRVPTYITHNTISNRYFLVMDLLDFSLELYI